MKAQEELRSLKPDLTRQNSEEQMATLRAMMLSCSVSNRAMQLDKMGVGLTSTLNHNKTRNKATFKSKSVARADPEKTENILKVNTGIGLKQDDMAAKIRDSIEEKDYSMHYLAPRSRAVEQSSVFPQARLDRVVQEVNCISKQLLADIQD